MHVILIPFGTAGDVHPFLGVAKVLRQRGHRVTLFSDSSFQDVILRNDLEFACLSSPDEYAELLRHPDLWHRTRSYPLLFKTLVAPKIQPVFEFVCRTYIPGQSIVVAANLALGARLACEKLRAPFVSLYVSPMCLPSYLHPPSLPGVNLFPGRPQKWMDLLFSLADWRVDRILGPALHSLCREHGMSPVTRIMNWWHSPELIVGLFPEWFARRESLWPLHTRLTGFPLYDTSDSTEIPSELESFLASGSPPIVFIPSSFMSQAGGFLRESVEACKRIHRRGILLTQFAEQIPSPLPEDIRAFRFVPLSRLLHRCSAIVHQGGIGTMAFSFAAGIPQLAVPMGMDQHANSERLRLLGTGTVISIKKYRADRVARMLTELMADESIHAACQRVAKLSGTSRPTEDACDLIEAEFKKHG